MHKPGSERIVIYPSVIYPSVMK